ncbi:type 1 fimbrial protein [Serratia ureilytica]|uniref:fimbrial protein n=1 Tax=Serratia ureilytica TaxID=300181 RepID=UPI0018A7C8C0|nr:fimbrial protein [Serratia ureilytica]MBF4185551.1 type 1 fimbrial protein [Serratia ureilytica]MBF8443043.1 type 1 fimbrial protein [Serratia ureilytica]MBF8447876.1 type 1 fimbrial protein [Serratia ureilytica]
MSALRKTFNTLQVGLLILFTNSASADLGRINLQLYATIVSPTCVIEPSSKNVIVDLPDYPGEASFRLKLSCPFDRGVRYTVSGSTTDAEGSVFTNTSINSPAQGVGIQLSDRLGVIKVNQERVLGTVGPQGKNLDLTATYATTGGKIQAGNIQSVIGITFIYP